MKSTEKPLKVSVCVVTYNQEKYIRQCLQSIVDQETEFDFEVIVGDDSSTDGTREIIEEFKKNFPKVVKPLYHRSNVGPWENYVATHNQALGEFVAHCDGDDLFLPEKLQKQIDFFQSNATCAVVWHRVNYFDDLGGFSPGEVADYSMFPNGMVTIESALRFGYVATHSSVMYRKSARTTYKPEFDTLDMFYSWEYLCHGWGCILKDVLGEYRINATGALTNSKEFKIRKMCADHSKFYLKKYPERRKDIFVYALANFLIDSKNGNRTAINFFLLALRSFSLISPRAFIKHVRAVRKFRLPVLSYENQ